MEQPKVGIGVLIFKENFLLLGKRIASHGKDTWAPPGGGLEAGESFEACAIREVKEETGLTITTPEFLAITNDIFADEQKHYVTIFMCVNMPEDQEVKNLIADKTESWEWCDVNRLPKKLFLPLQNLLAGEGKDLFLELTGLKEDLE